MAVDSGANVELGQTVVVSAKLGQEALAREIAAACYDRGAHHVQVDYADPWVSRARFQRAPEEALGTVIPWVRERPRQMAELQAAWIGLSGPPVPGVFDDVDPARIGRDTDGAELMRELVRRDVDANRLGEVALVDGSGRVGRTGRVFHDTLLDENAASHIALGSGFPHLGAEEAAANAERVNSSAVHTDFMIGGPDVEVTATTREGREVPVLIRGEWAL